MPDRPTHAQTEGMASRDPAKSIARHADRDDRLLTAAFVRLVLADLAYFTSAGVAIYVLPLWVTGPLGSNEAGAGLAFGAFAITALVLRPFAGRLADTLGRRPLLLGGAALSALAMGASAFASSLLSVVALRLLLGVAEAAFFVASFAVLADLAPPTRLGEALSYASLGLYLGLALGPPLGELLLTSAGFTATWGGAAALSVIAALIALGLADTRAPRDADERPGRLIHWQAIPPGLGFLAAVVAMGGFLAFASLQAAAVGLTYTSIPLFLYGAVVVLGRLAFAKFMDRVAPLLLGASALAVIAAGLVVTAVWLTPAGMLLGTALLGVGVVFSTPAFFSAIFATARPNERGAASGTASAFLDLGIGGGPILLGLAAAAAGIPFALMVAALAALAGSGWTLLLLRVGSSTLPAQDDGAEADPAA